MKFYPEKIQKCLNDILNGKPIIIVDDYDRENEGDLMIAAEFANKENLVFMMNYAKGLMCIPMTYDIIEQFNIPMMPSNNKDKFSTPFTVSVDANNGGSGMSVDDRLKTIGIFTGKNSAELNMPGHLFPLKARPNLLKDRQGHTEASVSLCKICDLKPIAIIIEIMNNQGEMMRGSELIEYANKFDLSMISVKEIEEIYNVKFYN